MIAVAAPHPSAVDAAAMAVAAGGSAVDAALAAAAALTVVYPHQCSLGGDLVALLHLPGGEVRAVLSIGAAAMSVDVESLRAEDSRMPAQGALSVTVPGVVAGWRALAEIGGARLGLAAPLRYAAGLAEDGVAVSPGLARAVTARRGVIQADPGLRELLTVDGVPRTVLRQPRLAVTLTELATEPDSFYRGAVARQLVDFLRGSGSELSTEDFAAHEPEVAEPLTAELAGVQWYVAPPPTQGVVLLAVLRGLAETTDLIGLCRRANADRDRSLGDPRTVAAGDTVAVTAVDSDGLGVSLIQSVYQSFGAGICDPATGIVLHNRGSAFSLLPGHPAGLGPGRRPPHTLCPAIGRSADVLIAVGCQGGRAQPQILAQTAPDLVRAADMAAVLALPRWVVGARDLGYPVETLLAEPGARLSVTPGIPVDRVAGPVDEAGHVQVARKVRERLDAASDPRADGAAVVLVSDEEKHASA